jgi:hypothetical protein
MNLRLWIALMAILLLASVGNAAETAVLSGPKGILLNVPETVTVPSELASLKLKAHEEVRILFHYLNHTGREQTFHISVDHQVDHLRWGASTSTVPGRAGCAGGAEFMGMTPHTDWVDLKVSVPAGDTVSGALEGEPKVLSLLKCSMGSGSTAKKVRVSYADSAISSTTVQMELGGVAKSCVGGHTAGLLPGGYGTTYHLVWENVTDSPAKLSVDFSPRGGESCLPYFYDNKVRLTGTVHAYATKRLFTVNLAPGKAVAIDVFAPGGWDLPVRFTATLRRAPVPPQLRIARKLQEAKGT